MSVVLIDSDIWCEAWYKVTVASGYFLMYTRTRCRFQNKRSVNIVYHNDDACSKYKRLKLFRLLIFTSLNHHFILLDFVSKSKNYRPITLVLTPLTFPAPLLLSCLHTDNTGTKVAVWDGLLDWPKLWRILKKRKC